MMRKKAEIRKINPCRMCLRAGQMLLKTPEATKVQAFSTRAIQANILPEKKKQNII